MTFIVDFIPVLIVGISLGSLFGLAGLAFTVVINACQLVNFAQGDFAMFSVAVCWFLMKVLHLPLWLAFPLGTFGGGFFGFLTHKAIAAPLIQKGARPFAVMIGTMAMGTIAAGGVGVYTKFWWMNIDRFLGPEPWIIGSLTIDTQGALIIGATLILVAGYWIFLNKTRWGTALRATGFNREVSTLMGIRTSRMIGLAFVTSGVIGGVAGILCAPLSAFTALDGLPLAVNGFIALIVGGWGNPYAALLGGVTLGLIRALLTGYFTSTHAEVATFLVLMIVLTLKPNGLFSTFMVPKARKGLG